MPPRLARVDDAPKARLHARAILRVHAFSQPVRRHGPGRHLALQQCARGLAERDLIAREIPLPDDVVRCFNHRTQPLRLVEERALGLLVRCDVRRDEAHRPRPGPQAHRLQCGVLPRDGAIGPVGRILQAHRLTALFALSEPPHPHRDLIVRVAELPGGHSRHLSRGAIPERSDVAVRQREHEVRAVGHDIDHAHVDAGRVEEPAQHLAAARLIRLVHVDLIEYAARDLGE